MSIISLDELLITTNFFPNHNFENDWLVNLGSRFWMPNVMESWALEKQFILRITEDREWKRSWPWIDIETMRSLQSGYQFLPPLQISGTRLNGLGCAMSQNDGVRCNWFAPEWSWFNSPCNGRKPSLQPQGQGIHYCTRLQSLLVLPQNLPSHQQPDGNLHHPGCTFAQKLLHPWLPREWHHLLLHRRSPVRERRDNQV